MTRLEELRDEIRALTPPQQLRLAASLLERGRPELARSIAERVVLELSSASALSAEPRR